MESFKVPVPKKCFDLIEMKNFPYWGRVGPVVACSLVDREVGG